MPSALAAGHSFTPRTGWLIAHHMEAALLRDGAALNDPRKMPSQLIDKPVPSFALPGLTPSDGGLSNNDLSGGIKLVIGG